MRTYRHTPTSLFLLAAAVLIAGCSDKSSFSFGRGADRALATVRQSVGVTVPADDQFVAFRCGSSKANDSLSDPLTGGTARDVVGDVNNPAFLRASDTDNI